MTRKTREDVCEALRNHLMKGVTSWVVRRCSICNVGLRYSWDAQSPIDGEIIFNPSCGCTTYPHDRVAITDVGEIAAYINLQTSEVAASEWARFLAGAVFTPPILDPDIA